MPNFYRATPDEANAIRAADGTILVHDWQAGTAPYMYQVGYGIAALEAYYAASTARASQTGLLSIIQGGDWRIWLCGMAENSVETLVAIYCSSAFSASILSSMAESTGEGLVPVIDETTGEVGAQSIAGKFGYTPVEYVELNGGTSIVYQYSVSAAIKQALVAGLKGWVTMNLIQASIGEALRFVGVPADLASQLAMGIWMGVEGMAHAGQRGGGRGSNAAPEESTSKESLDEVLRQNIEETKAKVDDCELADKQAELKWLHENINEKELDTVELDAIDHLQREVVTLQMARWATDRAQYLLDAINQRVYADAFTEEGYRLDATSLEMKMFDRLGTLQSDKLAVETFTHVITDTLKEIATYNEHCTSEEQMIKTEDFLANDAFKALLGVEPGKAIFMEFECGGKYYSWDNIIQWHEYVDDFLIDLVQHADSIVTYDPEMKHQNGMNLGIQNNDFQRHEMADFMLQLSDHATVLKAVLPFLSTDNQISILGELNEFNNPEFKDEIANTLKEALVNKLETKAEEYKNLGQDIDPSITREQMMRIVETMTSSEQKNLVEHWNEIEFGVTSGQAKDFDLNLGFELIDIKNAHVEFKDTKIQTQLGNFEPKVRDFLEKGYSPDTSFTCIIDFVQGSGGNALSISGSYDNLAIDENAQRILGNDIKLYMSDLLNPIASDLGIPVNNIHPWDVYIFLSDGYCQCSWEKTSGPWNPVVTYHDWSSGQYRFTNVEQNPLIR